MNKAVYCLSLDDFATPSFVSFSKSYFGNFSEIDSFINAIKNDEELSDRCKGLKAAYDKYIAGDKTVTHYVAYNEVPFLREVEFLGMKTSSLTDYKWKHLNTWEHYYYMKCKQADNMHIWVSYDDRYARCIKTVFTDLEYGISEEDYMLSDGAFWGYPHQIEYNSPHTFNRLFVTEKIFETKDEALQDMEEFEENCDVDFSEVLNDIFGDG